MSSHQQPNQSANVNVNANANHPDRNFWKKEEETLLKEWGDKAQCFHWMHLNAHRKYKKRNTWFTIPVIIISTITGTATFAQDKFGPYFGIASVVIGSLNIIAGIITTIYQFLKIAELNEGHKSAALVWEKYFETIKTELAKNPLDREKPMKLLKYCADQYEHLLEFSPIIPKDVIRCFKGTFKKKFKDIAIPTICGRLKPTPIFKELNDLVTISSNSSPSPDSNPLKEKKTWRERLTKPSLPNFFGKSVSVASETDFFPETTISAVSSIPSVAEEDEDDDEDEDDEEYKKQVSSFSIV